MSEIHYFPRYSQPENFVTNNTLLLLLRLYQYNRLKFERFMELLCADEVAQLATSWLHFRQQRGTGKSVLDGFIAQDSLKIAVETKLVDAFDSVQLERHLSVFGTEQHKVLILLSPSMREVPASQLEAIRQAASPRNIQVLPTSFADIVQHARACLSEHDEEMRVLVDDYETFCSDIGLLPRDKYTMFAPPCSQSFKDNIELRLYYCPASWSRRKAAYLGIYYDKSVRAIARIAKVVACSVDVHVGSVSLQDANGSLTREEQHRIVEATRRARSRSWDLTSDHKFYLCDELAETDFRKASPGGIQGHRYFDLEEVLGSRIAPTLLDLAAGLRGRTWQ
jgi:hypothetical protein